MNTQHPNTNNKPVQVRSASTSSAGETIPPATQEIQNIQSRKWIPSTNNITIAGREIKGMVYIGPNDITPYMQVASTSAPKHIKSMPYWPKYRNISPEARATYLDWLASERNNPDYDPGYMFLYFYGLEMRFLYDKSPQKEKQEILKEVKRLKNIYPKNKSVQKYLGEFIQLAHFILNEKINPEPTTWRSTELPLWLKVNLGKQIEQELPLTAKHMQDWIIHSPENQTPQIAKKYNKEFRALFEIYFQEQFPNGLKVAKPRKKLEYTYKSASNEFYWTPGNIPKQPFIPDISELTEPFDIAWRIANRTMSEINNFNRYIDHNPNKINSIEAHSLLPRQLRKIFPCNEFNQQKKWIQNIINAGGQIPVLDAIKNIEGSKLTYPTKPNLTRMTSLLEKMNFGFSPDPQFGIRAPKPHEPIILFNLGNTKQYHKNPTELYQTTLLKTALATFIAHANGQITENKQESILNIVGNTNELTSQEHCHLVGNIQWMLAVEPDLPFLKRKLKETKPNAIASLRTIMIKMAHADGIIQARKITAMEKIYKILGLDAALVYSDLHAGEINGGSVTNPTNQTGITEAPTKKLDIAKIAAIQSDTAQAASMLGDVFDETSGNPKQSQEYSSETENKCPNNLDEKHWQLIQILITREHWTEKEFKELCDKTGLMASAAVENLNEWAYEIHDEPLLEEYEGYEIMTGPAEQLKKQLEEGNFLVEP